MSAGVSEAIGGSPVGYAPGSCLSLNFGFGRGKRTSPTALDGNNAERAAIERRVGEEAEWPLARQSRYGRNAQIAVVTTAGDRRSTLPRKPKWSNMRARPPETSARRIGGAGPNGNGATSRATATDRTSARCLPKSSDAFRRRTAGLDGAPMSRLLHFGDIVAMNAYLYPDKVGARDLGRALTFRDWNDRSCRLANALLGLGLEKGDRIAVLAYNCLEWMEIYAAVAKAGLVMVPINFRLVGPEVQYIVENSEAKAVIVQDDLLDRLETIRAERLIAEDKHIHFGGKTPAGYRSYEDLIAAGARSEPSIETGPDDPYALLYTSGTTGKPKGVIRTNGGLVLQHLSPAGGLGLRSTEFGPSRHADVPRELALVRIRIRRLRRGLLRLRPQERRSGASVEDALPTTDSPSPRWCRRTTS